MTYLILKQNIPKKQILKPECQIHSLISKMNTKSTQDRNKGFDVIP